MAWDRDLATAQRTTPATPAAPAKGLSASRSTTSLKGRARRRARVLARPRVLAVTPNRPEDRVLMVRARAKEEKLHLVRISHRLRSVNAVYCCSQLFKIQLTRMKLNPPLASSRI